MGLNAVVGFAWQGGVRGALAPDAWNYWWVCVPVVVVGAPFGAWFIRHRSRLFVSRILYAAIAVQTVAAFLTVPLSVGLVAFCVGVFAAGSCCSAGCRRAACSASSGWPPKGTRRRALASRRAAERADGAAVPCPSRRRGRASPSVARGSRESPG